jgi:hypothetical protein
MTKSQQTIYQSSLISLSLSLTHSLSTYTIIHPQKRKNKHQTLQNPPSCKAWLWSPLTVIDWLHLQQPWIHIFKLPVEKSKQQSIVTWIFSSLFWVLMAVIQFIGKNSCDFFPLYFRFFNKINLMAIISNFTLWTWVPHFWQKLKFYHSGDLT